LTRTPVRLSSAAGSRLARLGAGLRRVTDLLPWTPLGLLVGVGTAAALRWLAFDQLDLVLLVVGYAAAGLLALSTLVVIIAALWLALRRSPEAAGVQLTETELERETGFTLPALRWVPLLQLEWSWLHPQVSLELSARAGRLHERVVFRERGEVREVTRRIVLQDAFGLCRVALRKREVRAFDVLPHVGALRTVPTLLSLAGGDDLSHPRGVQSGDRIDLSRYVPGDPARFIHWKIFGRTGKLMVRRPERALSPATRSAAFLVAAEHDEATAAAARVAIEQRMLGHDWVFGADVDASGTGDPPRALALIVRSPEARHVAGTLAGAFFDAASRQGPVNAIVFVPPLVGAWLAPIQQVARARRLHAVIATDGVDRRPPQPLWQRLLFRSPPVPRHSVADLERVVAELSAVGCSVTVVDRVGGHVLGQRHLSGMRDLAPAPMQVVA